VFSLPIFKYGPFFCLVIEFVQGKYEYIIIIILPSIVVYFIPRSEAKTLLIPRRPLRPQGLHSTTALGRPTWEYGLFRSSFVNYLVI
jgi:hypothetical protein